MPGAVKIATWNVNSVRARVEQLIAYLEWARPDVLCLQELKCQDQVFPNLELQAVGYHAVTHGQKSYNGVAILARAELPITDVVRGLDDDAPDDHARAIAATVGGVRVVSLYCPNGQAVGAPAYAYKLEWFARLRRYLDRHLDPSDPLALCGDYNVAPDDRDVYDPIAWEGSVLVSAPERAALDSLKGFGLVDTFRLHHQDAARYSWWDYRQLAFPKNLGLRIDLVLASQPLATRCLGAGIDREARKGKSPSDHAPVWATFGD